MFIHPGFFYFGLQLLLFLTAYIAANTFIHLSYSTTSVLTVHTFVLMYIYRCLQQFKLTLLVDLTAHGGKGSVSFSMVHHRSRNLESLVEGHNWFLNQFVEIPRSV
jgi:hypothetical protein